MPETTIEWASHSLNFYRWNCTPVSPGCKNCYAHERARRFPNAANAGDFLAPVAWRDGAWKELKKFPAGAVIFVNSHSDTYHETAPLRYIHAIHNTAMLHPDKAFLILTKRPERLYGLRDQLAFPKNLWVGTSVENGDYLWRLDYLLRVPAAGHFLSAEPLIGRLNGEELAGYFSPVAGIRVPYRAALQWVIVGGESGAQRRDFYKLWALEIRDVCERHGIKFLYKQGSALKPGQDRQLYGRTWDETPDFDLELPERLVQGILL